MQYLTRPVALPVYKVFINYSGPTVKREIPDGFFLDENDFIAHSVR